MGHSDYTGFFLEEQEKRNDEHAKRETEQRHTERQETQKEPKEELTKKELKQLAKEKEIEGYSNMNKAELIEALKE